MKTTRNLISVVLLGVVFCACTTLEQRSYKVAQATTVVMNHVMEVWSDWYVYRLRHGSTEAQLADEKAAVEKSRAAVVAGLEALAAVRKGFADNKSLEAQVKAVGEVLSALVEAVSRTLPKERKL